VGSGRHAVAAVLALNALLSGPRPRRSLIATWLTGLGLSVLLACSPPPTTRQPPPLDQSPGSRWAYGAYLLGFGEATAALGYLEPLAGGPPDTVSNAALLLRDVAEARLAVGDLGGAASAARAARVELARRARSAQFQADDRRVFERVIDGLEAAGDDNLQQLSALAADEGATPSADVWYLLGWVEERHGDLAAAQVAYRSFLARSPQWSFLRQAVVMRQHAQASLAR
jgi:hypothetical protein